MQDQVKVFAGTSITINRIALLLDENGIPSIIKDNVESARLAGFGAPQNDVELYVIQSDFNRARKIIEEFEKENATKKL